eukprot:758766-Hanusia_phi.AAC.3
MSRSRRKERSCRPGASEARQRSPGHTLLVQARVLDVTVIGIKCQEDEEWESGGGKVREGVSGGRWKKTRV